MKFRQAIFPGLSGLLVYIIIRLVTDVPSGEQFWHRSFRQNLIEVILCINMGYILNAVLVYANRRFSDTSRFSMQSLLKEFALLALGIIAVINPVVLLIHVLVKDPVDKADLVIANCIGLLFSMLYYAIVRGNFLLKKYVDQRTKLQQLEADSSVAELKYLKGQYHPHFLFNALNTIYFQMDEDVQGAKRTLENFSGLLRYQLYDQQQQVTMKQEMEHLKSFVELQQQRSSSRLKMGLQIDEQLGKEKVYPLLFLPLVENAFKYLGGGYTILIRAWRDRDLVIFFIENGISENSVVPAGGIGLDNLRRRLKLLYPSKHSLYSGKQGSRWTAELKIDIS